MKLLKNLEEVVTKILSMENGQYIKIDSKVEIWFIRKVYFVFKNNYDGYYKEEDVFLLINDLVKMELEENE